MSDDETPTTDEAPDATTDASSSADASTATSDAAPDGAPRSDTDATVPDQSAATVSEPAPSTPPAERSGVFVPKWVAVLVGGLVAVLVIGGAGFALGRATDDGGRDDDAAVEVSPAPQLPGGGGSGESPFPIPNGGDDGGTRRGDDGGSGGDGGELPSIPSRGVLLGISVEPADGTDGAQVAQVVPDSAADDAGLEAGDVITDVDGTAISDPEQLVEEIQAHDPGDEVTITFERDGDSQTVDVTLGGSDSGSNGDSDDDASSSN